MTVFARPLPGRIASSGGRILRPVVPANNIRPYTVKTWRPPVPEPLAPAPLLGPVGLLLTGIVALGQYLWGLLNSKTPQNPNVAVNATLEEVVGTPMSGGGYIDLYASYQTRRSSYSGVTQQWTCGLPIDSPGAQTMSLRHTLIYSAGGGALTVTQSSSPCAPQYVTVAVSKGTNQTYGSWQWNGSVAAPPQGMIWIKFKFVFRDGSGSPVPFVYNPPPAIPQADPVVIPVPKVAPTIAPAVVPLVPVPALPEVEPEPELEPAPIGVPLPPTIAPAALPPLIKPAAPSALPLQNGAVVAPAPLPVPTTDPNAVYPIPGRPPIVGNGPQANLQEMAKELGRIEAKMHSLMNPTGELNPIPEWMNDLGDGLSKLLQLWELLTATQAGGQYTLSSECVLDAEGNRVESVAEYSGAFNWLQVLSNKMDALAELQQHAKDLKQPVCRHKAVGQPVTVTFTQQE